MNMEGRRRLKGMRRTILFAHSIDPTCLRCIFSISCKMDDTIWSTQMKIRNACQECHTRKIKCIMPDEGGACRACKSTGRNCYFLPRQKCGRVPGKQNEKRRPSRTTASSESPHNAFQPADSAGMLTAFTQFESSYLSPSIKIGDRSFMNESMSFPFLDSTSDKYPTTSGHSSHTSLSSMANDSAHIGLTKPYADIQNSDRQMPQAHSGGSLVSRAHHKLSIRLLHECHQIQTQSEIFSSTGIVMDGIVMDGMAIPRAIIQSTIHSVDTICHGILEVSGNKTKEVANLSSLSDSRLMSVAMAATFTVLEVCEVLAADPTSASQGPDYTLMWKRLDLNLTQLRVALQRMLKIGGPFSTVIKQAITRAKILDNRIKSSVQDAYSDWEDAS